ncbi:MAG: tail protein [Chaetfec virus UA24_244]|nr:MAG: tail protein [Chaetfec virus UA24_244]
MERKLIDYLPYVVQDFKEFQGITTGEQPEFELAWDSHDEVFTNQFIDTMGNYGLSRWEKMLKISPKGTDTLETRRARIKARLSNFIPYPIRAFIQMLTAIANGEPFTLTLEPESYLLEIMTEWSASGQVEGLEYLIDNILPCNIAISATNKLLCIAEGTALFCGGVCFVHQYLITNDFKETNPITEKMFLAGGVVNVDFITHANNLNGTFTGEDAAVSFGNGNYQKSNH